MKTHIQCSMVYAAHDLIRNWNWKTEREKSSGVPPLTLSAYVALCKTHLTSNAGTTVVLYHHHIEMV